MSFLLKLLFFYFLFLLLRTVYRLIMTYLAVKKVMRQGQGPGEEDHHHNATSNNPPGVVEAEYRVLNKEDSGRH